MSRAPTELKTRTETELPSVSPINAGVLHAGECSVVYCCAIQCLPRNLATHGAELSERKEGRHGAAALHFCRATAFLEVSMASTVTAWGKQATIL
jgi:hypothetical protein